MREDPFYIDLQSDGKRILICGLSMDERNVEKPTTAPVDPSRSPVTPAAPATPAAGKGDEGTPSWERIQHDLKSALDGWAEMSKTEKVRRSPEERKLDDIKRLLDDLRSKLDDFENL